MVLIWNVFWDMSGHGRCEQRFKNGYSHCPTQNNAKYEGKVKKEYLLRRAVDGVLLAPNSDES